MGNKFINPLESVSNTPTNEGIDSTEEKLKSESAMLMEGANICPKCKNPMSKAIIDQDEPVFWCKGGCRVSAPVPIDGE